jgi:hypothetical protein
VPGQTAAIDASGGFDISSGPVSVDVPQSSAIGETAPFDSAAAPATDGPGVSKVPEASEGVAATDALDFSSAPVSGDVPQSSPIAESAEFDSAAPAETEAPGDSSVAAQTDEVGITGGFLISRDFTESGALDRSLDIDDSFPLRATPAFAESESAGLTEALIESGFFGLSSTPGSVDLDFSEEIEGSVAVPASPDLGGSNPAFAASFPPIGSGDLGLSRPFSSDEFEFSRPLILSAVANSAPPIASPGFFTPSAFPHASLNLAHTDRAGGGSAAIAASAEIRAIGTAAGFAESSALSRTESLVSMPGSADHGGGGSRTTVDARLIAILAAGLGLLVVGVAACGLILWRGRDDSTIPTDDAVETDTLSTDCATEMELTVLSDYDMDGQLECENPLLSGGESNAGSESSGFGSLSDSRMDEALGLL